MSAVRMDGKALSAKVRGSILAETEELKKKGVTPGLAVIIVGNDPASEIYVRNKERACEQCDFYSEKYALPEETTQEELLGLIAQLNESPQISGILCQMPVPKHISEQAVIDAIDPKKDVDAFHPVNVGKIMVGNFDFVPCTPAGVMELLDEPRHRDHLPQPHAEPRRDLPPRGHSGGGGRQGRLHHPGHGKGRRGRHRRRHQPQRRGQGLRRRRARGYGKGVVHDAGPGRRRPHDHHHADEKHPQRRKITA